MTTGEQVAYLLERVPQAAENPVLLCLLYWKVFDGIEIPADLMKIMAEKATGPETILRYKRMFSKGEEAS